MGAFLFSSTTWVFSVGRIESLNIAPNQSSQLQHETTTGYASSSMDVRYTNATIYNHH